MKNQQPKPYNIRFAATIRAHWNCPSCRTHNTSVRNSRDEYLSAKCGSCHSHYILDYHRSTDAPPEALALDHPDVAAAIRTERAAQMLYSYQPRIPRKSAQKLQRRHAGDSLK